MHHHLPVDKQAPKDPDIHDTVHSEGRDLAAAARGEYSRGHAGHSVRRFHTTDRFPLPVQLPGRLDGGAVGDRVAVAGDVGHRLRREGKRGNPLRHRFRSGWPPHGPRHGNHRRDFDRGAVCRRAAGDLQIHQLHEDRKELVSPYPPGHPVLGLRPLHRRRDRSLSLDPVGFAARKDPRLDHPGLRPVNFASPFSLCIMTIVALTLLGLPIGHAMIGGSVLYHFMAGLDAGTAAEQLSNGMYGGFVLLAIPLFMLAAEFMTSGSITERLVRFCNAFVGRFRGGLALVVVVQNINLTSMSGSALADAAATGKLMQAMMTQDGKYRASFAAALQAVAAVIGPIIPPSIPLVVYSLISDTSVGYLFLGGVIPGLLLGAAQMSLIAYIARRQNFPVERAVPMRELPRITGEAFPALMMPVILLGALYSGITTPTEAAALAALYALLVSALYYKSLSWSDVYRSLLNTAKISGSIGILIAAAMVFNYVVTIENIPKTLSAMLTASQMSPLAYLMVVNVLLLILGCLLEGTTIILIILPVLLPTATALGIDPVHFGVVAVVNIMIGLVTPPYGLLLFIMVKIAKVPLRDIVREAAPFLAVMIATLLLITVVPDLVLWLPRLMGYKG